MTHSRFVAALLLLTTPHAEAQNLKKAQSTCFLSVARLSVMQKGNDFFAKYRVSVNNEGADTLYYYDSNCASISWQLTDSRLTFVEKDCIQKKKTVYRIAPGEKQSREILITGKTNDVRTNPPFRILFNLEYASAKDKQKKLLLRTPELHLLE